MLTGTFLILVGVGLIVAQIWLQVTSPETAFPVRSLEIEGAGAKASLKTTYVGLVLVVVGAVLEAIGFLASKPWKQQN
jgi:hypothetical protein